MASAAFEEIVEDFEFLEDWEDRYRHVIEHGKAMAPLDEALKVPATKVDGCASQVWLHASLDGDTIILQGDSDAHIVKGLVALLLALYSGKRREEVLAINPEDALAPFDLKDHLTPQRSNGLHSMIKRIRAIAETT